MKKENKKKVVTLSAMAALLAVVLGMGGKTYAKYFTSANFPAQTATVAKWGIVINTPNVDNLFGKTYADDDSNKDTSAVVTAGDTNIVVKGSSSSVAPGTKGGMSFTVTGLTEVKAQVTVTVDFTNQVHLDSYYPMVWSLDGATKDYTSTISAEAEDYTDTQVIEAGTNADYSFSLNWEWAFEQGKNTEDTILGKYAHNGGETLTTAEKTAWDSKSKSTEVAFEVRVEVTQLAA